MGATRKKTLIILLVSACITPACHKDLNDNPNVVQEAPINSVLPNITTNVAFVAGSEMHRFTSLWAQQFAGQGPAGSATTEFEKYNVVTTDFINPWSNFYTTTLVDAEYVINHSSESPYYNGIAKILKAWCFQQVVDMWGDVPFSEALKTTVLNHPKPDKDADIYPQLISLLNDGIAQLSKPKQGLLPGKDDTIYRGVTSKWIKLANSLKFRILLHYSEIDPVKVKTDMDAMINSGVPVISTNDDNFQMNFVDAPNSQNPIHQFEIIRPNQFFPNIFLVNMMNQKADPRRAAYFTPFPYNSSPATYKGATPGDAQAFNYSRLHTYLRGELTNSPVALPDGSLSAGAAIYTGAAPIRLLTAAEYYFIRAEASLRFGASGDAQSLYRSGISASMEAAGVGESLRDAYLSANGTLQGTLNDQLKQIIEEKYVALYGVSVEPYNDWRRTGYPAILPVPNSTLTPKAIPTIFYYPQIEINANPNIKQKPNLFQKVFWDK